MNRSVFVIALLLCLAAAPALAESKIATANPLKILSEAKETKDFNKAIEADQAAAKAEEQSRVDKIRALDAQRQVIKPDAPQYNELTKQIVSAQSDAQAWKKNIENDLARKYRDHVRKMYDKMDAVITELAKAKGADIVIAEQKAEVDEQQMAQLAPQQIMQVLFTRTILYKGSTMDLTAEVIAKLDAGYNPAAGGASTPTPAPAPASTPAPAGK